MVNVLLPEGITFNLGGNDVVVTLVGQETSRTFVPEPASGLLVGLGLLAALGVPPRRAPLHRGGRESNVRFREASERFRPANRSA